MTTKNSTFYDCISNDQVAMCIPVEWPQARKPVSMPEFVDACEASKQYRQRRQQIVGVGDAGLDLVTTALVLFSLTCFCWLVVIMRRVCCWHCVTRNKLATHAHLLHHEEIAVRMFQHQVCFKGDASTTGCTWMP